MSNLHLNRYDRVRIRIRLLILISAVVLLVFDAPAERDPFVMSSGIYKTEWRWEAGATAEFEGNMICENVSEDHPLIMSLSVDVLPEGTEKKEPHFTRVNGEKQSVKRPKSEITISSSDQAIRFSGGWEIPEGVRIEEATIHLKIYNQEYELLSESDLQMRNDQITAGETGYRFPEIGNRLWIIIGAAAAIWMMAVIRIIVNRQRRE